MVRVATAVRDGRSSAAPVPDHARHFVAVSGSLDERMVEYVDHLHEHFVEPVRVVSGRYLLPRSPGYAAMTRRALDEHRFPDGPVWSGR